MRKLFSVLLVALIIIYVGFVAYSNKYSIPNNRNQLEDSITQFINRPSTIIDKIEIKQELNLDNKKYVIFIVNNGLAFSELTKGLNNKYRIEVASYGNGYFRDDICETKNGKYLILRGRNDMNKIAYVKVQLDSKEYKIKIPQQEYFITYCRVPKETEKKYLEYNYIKFYDKNDIDITDKVLES